MPFFERSSGPTRHIFKYGPSRIYCYDRPATDGGLQWKHSPQDYFKTFVPDPDQLWNFKTIYQASGKLSDRVAEASNAIRVGISDL